MPARHRFDEVFRRARAHQIARPIVGQQRRRVANDARTSPRPARRRSGRRWRSASNPTSTVAARALLAQIRIDAALDDAELRLARIGDGDAGHGAAASSASKRSRAAPRPSQRALHRRARRVSSPPDAARHSSSTIAMSDPSCAWMSAAFSGVSRCARPVEMRPEVRALLVDRPARGEAEDLIAAAVGQDRTRQPMNGAGRRAARSDRRRDADTGDRCC